MSPPPAEKAATREPCPLCESPDTDPFHRDRRRKYWRCPACRLIHVPSTFFLTEAEEKAEYDLHENHPGDSGYRRFLSRLHDPLVERLPERSHGLDFGCGPGPTLSVMLEETGHPMAVYDPFYAPSREVLESTYDFVTATEVVEHLHRPKEELSRMWSLVRPGGWLALMTKLALAQDPEQDRQAFSRWHYKNDLTHVCFFSRPTFQWLGRRLGSPPVFIGSDVILFQKPRSDAPPRS